ncbi:hypothetical protein SAMD00023353_1301650 [Rosellinia necatrix]|uniref:Uncharacterized protein n=1 Tax=Rosellinia necatrix TaxID=77044 RepID=A0A1S8A7B5_ROSNE|nr:hypothetical protein SAMD00023353_1301650 [Rosellinia necatrix]
MIPSGHAPAEIGASRTDDALSKLGPRIPSAVAFDPSLRRPSALLLWDLDLFEIIDAVSISLALVASSSAWLMGRIFLEHNVDIGRMFAAMMFRFCSSLGCEVRH